jgi:hypothetical protein
MTWTVRALQWHTFNGVAYNEGDIYIVDESLLDTLEALRFAHRVSPTDPNDPG